jgi:hypothetical protein
MMASLPAAPKRESIPCPASSLTKAASAGIGFAKVLRLRGGKLSEIPKIGKAGLPSKPGGLGSLNNSGGFPNSPERGMARDRIPWQNGI